ncbi:hypothetical protein [Rudanella lutea]|uniref:hypothetical protein n=1 Tax=Rudanella lutea TaxID=451374 RepID=UPI0003746856|nr:hypothetical protein [Rudanella lutea]
MKKLLFAGALLASGAVLGQSVSPTPAPPANDTIVRVAKQAPTPAADKNELKYNLNASGTHFFKVTFLNQTWLRLNQSNPGTTVIQEAKPQTLDIGLRRTRMQMFGQLNDRALIYLQFGMNNFNYLNGFPGFNTAGTPSNRKIAAFFHDAVGEYLVFRDKDYLKIGGGLTIVNGLSRFSQPSVSSIMTMDVPVFAQATVDQTDEFSRKLTVYARGQVGKIDYRFALSDPFPIQTTGATPPALSSNATFALKGHHKQVQGFVAYQFLDKETNQTPGYMTGTYLGKKRMLNLEGGFVYQKNAVWHRENVADTVYQNLNLWSLAAFLDMPVSPANGSAINAYLGYFHTDYGKDYLRFNGIMNPASGSTITLPGASGIQGNAFPMFGTGNVVYSQVGYLLPQDLLGRGNGALMPYAQAQIARYTRLTQPLGVYNIGLNWLIRGHNSKMTLDYQNRPYYGASGTQLAPAGRRGQLTLQYQVFI